MGKKTDSFPSHGAFLPPSARLRAGRSIRRSLAGEAEIGKKMRAMYAELLEQPIPDRFVELLRQIDQAQETKPQ